MPLEKLESNLQEARARGGGLCVVADLDGHLAAGEGVHVLRVSGRAGLPSPVVHVVQLQLLAHHADVIRGAEVDEPCNRAKSAMAE
ncbi:MAG: hypothetical protein BroJett026_15940 [Betaproteobacteria bacterium]|nr:MAG: hypothetical protein BroJett026_15940 [Betaproteobacteria bacterium]